MLVLGLTHLQVHQRHQHHVVRLNVTTKHVQPLPEQLLGLLGLLGSGALHDWRSWLSRGTEGRESTHSEA